MAFQNIGFHTALILNRLRNERDKSDVAEDQRDRDGAQEKAEADARAKLTFVKQRLTELAEFERRARGEKRSVRKRR